MNDAFLIRLLACIAALGFATVAARAQDPALKARMEQRIGALDALKDRGVVGENNRGLLEVRGQAAPADAKLVSDENADRSAVYAALAQQTGSTPDVVARKRAQQIAERSKPGVWIQDPSGQWRQK